MNVRFFDTAGLHDSGDQVERIGMERAEKALREADVVLLTLDASRPLTQEDRGLLARDYAGELLVLLNKSDLPDVYKRQAPYHGRTGPALPHHTQRRQALPLLR